MKKRLRVVWGVVFMIFFSSTVFAGGLRVPAEWEPHEATWMQWPGMYEADMRQAFADIIDVIQAYEPVHIIAGSRSEKNQAQKFLGKRKVPLTNITWHVRNKNNAWLRDNGPVYVTDGNDTWIQNWGFDGWGGNFGSEVEYKEDNRIPVFIGQYLGLAVQDRSGYVMEKGNLEFNGSGTLLVNWDCQDDRNPGMSEAEHEALLKEAFGVTRIIWAYGHHPDDGTTGHIDGAARFIDEHTVVITDTGDPTENDLIADCKAAGLKVILYPGDPNWLVGNGFVAAMGDGSAHDKVLKSMVESFFPDRDVHMIDARSISDSGGGIHCVTNDQPKM